MPVKEYKLYKVLRNNYYAYCRKGGKTELWCSVLNQIFCYYRSDDKNFMPDYDPKVIVMIDGKSGNANGLSDRLRGILSVFSLCIRLNVCFKIHWIFPFSLTDYLIPNRYDWTIEASEIHRSTPYSSPFIRFVMGGEYCSNRFWI